MRPLDEKDRLQKFFGRALDEEQAAIDEFEQEHSLFVGLGRDAQFEFDFVTFRIEAAGLEVHTQIDRRANGQRHGRAGILE